MALIEDLYGNSIETQSSPMIGFIESEPEAPALRLDAYKFIIEIIRQEDQKNGNLFLKRFMGGPQESWARTNDSILNLKSLWNVSTIDDSLLPYLKQIVGWTPDLDVITDSLDAITLRRLIAASVPFWKRRGPEDSIEDILRLTTTARVRTWNWFDLRIVMDETAFGEDWNGYDPWMVDDAGERQYNIRIVDDGTLDHDLVMNLAQLTRPSGETVTVSFIGFLDQFQTDADNSQWADEPNPLMLNGGASVSTVANGSMSLGPLARYEEAYVSLGAAEDWTNYVATFRLRGSNYRIVFYRSGNGDFYEVLAAPSGVVTLTRSVAGTRATLATFDLADLLVELHDDVFNAFRVEATPEGNSTHIKVYFESVAIIDTTDATLFQGTIGIGHTNDTGAFVVLDEAELFFNPLQSITIGINP